MSPEKWKGWSVYMSNFPDANVRGCEGDPGEQGYWNFKQIGSTNKYLVSTKKWPNWYMYMQNNFTGNVKGCEGEPGSEGQWMITQYGTVIVGGQSLPTYTFRNEKWCNWYMYMDDGFTGNVRGSKGDPGDQGHFILKKT